MRFIEHKKEINKLIRKDGFSLIELVVVVAVLAILSAIAIPSFSDIRKKSMINVAKQNLILIIKEFGWVVKMQNFLFQFHQVRSTCSRYHPTKKSDNYLF